MTRPSHAHRVLLFAASVALGACAHVPRSANDAVPFAPLARPSHFWVKWPHGAMYEGDVNIPVPLFSRTRLLTNPEHELAGKLGCPNTPLGTAVRALAQTSGSDSQPEIHATGCTITFTPHFVIRQLSGGSAPVQTPTFNPGLEYTRFDLRLEDSARAVARHTARGGPVRTATLSASHFRFAHYSNGQSGCLYTNQMGESCSTDPTQPERLNTVDGSFSTHYLETGISIGRVHYDADGAERRVTAGTTALRWNFPGFADEGGMSPELARNYGRWSVSGGLSTRIRSGKSWLFGWRMVTTLSVEGECAFQRPDAYQPCRVSGGGALTFPAVHGAGVALRWVDGWDYYNVGFGDRMRNSGGWRPMLGIVIDHSIPMRIHRDAPYR